MTIDEVLCLLRAKEQRSLNPIQELVLRQAWKGQTYAGMAKEFHYDANYLKNLAAELWHDLSEMFGMSITKTNFRITLEDRQLTPRERQEIDSLSSNLLPTPLEFPSGPVPLNSPFYIDRTPLEDLAYREIAKPGSVIRLKAPRLMGKSSLLLRILDRAARPNIERSAWIFRKPMQTFWHLLMDCCAGFAPGSRGSYNWLPIRRLLG